MSAIYFVETLPCEAAPPGYEWFPADRWLLTETIHLTRVLRPHSRTGTFYLVQISAKEISEKSAIALAKIAQSRQRCAAREIVHFDLKRHFDRMKPWL